MQDVQDRRRGRERLLTSAEVGAALGIDQSTVYRMAADGRLPAVKVGRQWRFPAETVEQLLSAPLAPPERPVPAHAKADPATPALDPAAASAAVTVAADLLGVMMVVTDMEGHPVTPVANPCPGFAVDDPATVSACAAEWRVLADELDLQPRFRLGALGFECARAYVRSGDRLVGMVLAGGLAPAGADDPGLYHLGTDARAAVLGALPRVAAVLSSAAPYDTDERDDLRSA